MKKGAIFDMDGLLFNTELVFNTSWHEVANSHGLSIHEEMLDELRGTNGMIMNTIINSYIPNADAEKLVQEVFAFAKKALEQSVPMKEGVIEILPYFKDNNVKLALASSAPLDLILNNLKKSNTDIYFDVIVSGQQVINGKPEPDIFISAADKLMLNPSDCYVFEDGFHGVEAAVRAGCSTIMVPDLLVPTKKQYEVCCGIYTSLRDVLAAIKEGQI